jgi:nucleotide-binding universal stress UspA family protein
MYDDILVPTDGSEHATAALREALELADEYGATLHVLSVVDSRDLGLTTPADVEALREGHRETSERAVEAALDAASEAGVPTTSTLEVGLPHARILEYADEADVDLVVMGTHGRSGLRRAVLGSVTERVLRASAAPVLTVHGDSADGEEGV